MIDTLLSAAHLRRELGEELFEAIVSSDNTAAVRKLAKELVNASLPTEMTLGGVTYEILSFLKGYDGRVDGDTMVEQAKQMQAHLGEYDCRHLLKHQAEIPAALRGKVVFVFTDWYFVGGPGYVSNIGWSGESWILGCGYPGPDCDRRYRVLRRKLHTEMTIGGRTYDILSFLREDEESVLGLTMVGRAQKMNAHQGKEEREHLLKHQHEIPAALRGKVVFVFTDDRRPDSSVQVYCVCWGGGRWVEGWCSLTGSWDGLNRVLRRKFPSEAIAK